MSDDAPSPDGAPILSKPCTLLFLRRGDEILLAMKKRGFGVGKWNGAGGKVEANETIEEAMIREAEEEIGVTPLKFHKVAVHNFHSIKEDGTFSWGNVGHTFFCDEWRGDPKETEEMAPRWFKISEIPYDKMWEDDELWLPLVLEGKLLRTTFSFGEDDAMLTHDIHVVEHLDDEG